MQFIRLTTSQDPRYAAALALYSTAFPVHEQRLAASQQAILQHPAYQFRLICEDGAFAGILLGWEMDAFFYAEHFAIAPEKRNRGCGELALRQLQRECTTKGQSIILEIDPPVDDISRRRKGFYERCGFQENPFPHVHPPYRPEHAGHALAVLSCPERLSQAQYDDFYRYLCDTVMDHCY